MWREISTFASVYEKRSVMDAEKPSVETLIATVLSDIQQKGYSSIQPFDIGEVEERMMLFAQANGVSNIDEDGESGGIKPTGIDSIHLSEHSWSVVIVVIT